MHSPIYYKRSHERNNNHELYNDAEELRIELCYLSTIR